VKVLYDTVYILRKPHSTVKRPSHLLKKPDAGAIDALPRLEFLAIASMHLSETELQVKVGMTVTHKSYGAGKVVGEWHSIRSGVPCKDIFDVIFQNRSGCPFLHCCRKEYLTPDPLFFTLGE
jgi:hypothetical protein